MICVLIVLALVAVAAAKTDPGYAVIRWLGQQTFAARMAFEAGANPLA